jgi:hypothetical protein
VIFCWCSNNVFLIEKEIELAQNYQRAEVRRLIWREAALLFIAEGVLFLDLSEFFLRWI